MVPDTSTDHLSRRKRYAGRAVFLLAGGLLLAASPAAGAAADGGATWGGGGGTPGAVGFSCTGTVKEWTVPATVYTATFELAGAQAGHPRSAPLGAYGLGGRVVATIDVNPGEVLQVRVGCQGGMASLNEAGGRGGWNGGGDGGLATGYDEDHLSHGAGGGGASDVRRRNAQGQYGLQQRILVAGGGGGNGWDAHDETHGIGGGGGGQAGLAGYSGGFTHCYYDPEVSAYRYDGAPNGVGAGGGGGGTAGGGGTGGAAGQASGPLGTNTGGTAGSLGQGGKGGDSFSCFQIKPGGGGGGGYYGGGGGGGADNNGGGGGGGGSSFGPAGATFTSDVHAASGQVVIRWVVGDPPPAARRPDGRIRLGTTGAFVGNDIYNVTGADQQKTVTAAVGGTVILNVSIQNDAPASDAFKVRASGSITGYDVTYLHGTTDITAAVVAGTYQTPSLAANGTHLLKVRVRVRNSASPGSRISRLMTITSLGDSTKKDAVKFTVRRA